MEYQEKPVPHDEILSDLLNVRNFLSDPARWTKGAVKRTSCDTGEESYCLGGAVLKMTEQTSLTYLSERAEKVFAYLAAAIKSPIYNSCKKIVHFNDSRATTHASILEVIDKAIELRRSIVNAPNERIEDQVRRSASYALSPTMIDPYASGYAPVKQTSYTEMYGHYNHQMPVLNTNKFLLETTS